MPVHVAIAIAAAVLVIATAIGLILHARDGHRRGGAGLRVAAEDIAPRALAERATLVQFSTELCARCPQVRRMLGGIADAQDGVAHVEIDLTHRADLATRYHVLQTPTTFLVDASGAVRSRWGGVPDRQELADALAAVPTLQENR